MIRAIIIDDEKLARDVIKSYLVEDQQISIISEYSNGFDGLKAIQEHKPDLVFLDIMMPKINGFEMLELMDEVPEIIFSTAYDQYAIRAFEQNAVDYLLKPYSKERFIAAIEKAKTRLQNAESSASIHASLIATRPSMEPLTRIVVKVGNKIQLISVDQICYLEAMDDYVYIHAIHGKFLKQGTMKFFESGLDPDQFIRIHRSYLVAISEIAKIEPMSKDTHVCILKDGRQLPISRSGYSRLKESLRF